tara:strand:+ start:3994 stop:4371 length:378 start_codon:yes stop_codon:yes gene_type:complete
MRLRGTMPHTNLDTSIEIKFIENGVLNRIDFIKPHHLIVPENMKFLCVIVDTSIDPWDDETVLKVFPSIPRGIGGCRDRLQYLQNIDFKAYEKNINAGMKAYCINSIKQKYTQSDLYYCLECTDK